MKKVLKILFLVIAILTVVGIAQALTDFYECNTDGSASATGVFCNANNGANEDETDATMDNCTDGASAGHPDEVSNIKITEIADGGGAEPDGIFENGDVVKVACTLDCFAEANEYGIMIYNVTDGVWAKPFDRGIYGNCPGPGSQVVVRKFVLPHPGLGETWEQPFRCWISWQNCNSGTTCCQDEYADSDDVKISVQQE